MAVCTPQLTPPASLPPLPHCAYLDRSDSLQAAFMGCDDAPADQRRQQQHGVAAAAAATAAHAVDLARIAVQGAPWDCDMVEVLMAAPTCTVAACQ